MRLRQDPIVWEPTFVEEAKPRLNRIIRVSLKEEARPFLSALFSFVQVQLNVVVSLEEVLS